MAAESHEAEDGRVWRNVCSPPHGPKLRKPRITATHTV